MHDEPRNAAAPDQQVRSWFGSDSLLEETVKKVRNERSSSTGSGEEEEEKAVMMRMDLLLKG